jgi:signal transduction histidine kinase
VPASLRGGERTLVVAGPAVVMAVVGLVSLWSGRSAADRENLVRHTDAVVRRLDQLAQRVTDAETGQRGYVITGDTTYLEPYRHAQSDADGALVVLRRMMADQAGQQRRLDTMTGAVRRKFHELDTTIALRRAGDYATTVRLINTDRGQALMDSIRAIDAALSGTEDSLLAVRTAAAHRQRVTAAGVLVLGTIIAIVIGLTANGWLADVARERAATAERLDSQNAQLTAQASQLAMQNDELQTSAAEVEAQSTHLQEQQTEVEAANEELQSINEELVQLNDLLERRTIEAEAGSTAKTLFLTTMSHELRTPLNAISGYTDLIEVGVHGPVTPEQLEDLARIRRAATHLLGLLTDIINFARLGSLPASYDLLPVAIDDALATTAAMVEPQVRAKKLHLERIACDRSCTVVADRDKLRQIMLNVLTNAVKFTPPGGRITVRCWPTGERTRIEVRDTGIGIPRDKLELIFEPFVQLARARSPWGGGDNDGIGLGLAISRALARGMAGDLTVESTLGEGSAFWLELTSGPPLPE